MCGAVRVCQTFAAQSTCVASFTNLFFGWVRRSWLRLRTRAGNIRKLRITSRIEGSAGPAPLDVAMYCVDRSCVCSSTRVFIHQLGTATPTPGLPSARRSRCCTSGPLSDCSVSALCCTRVYAHNSSARARKRRLSPPTCRLESTDTTIDRQQQDEVGEWFI